MEIQKTKLKNVLLFKPIIFNDFRGAYTEVFNEKDYFDKIKIILNKDVHFVTDSEVFSRKNVLRGLHGDDRTWKLFHCSKGTIYIVIVNCDLESESFGQWESFELSAENKFQLLVPPKYGNGTLALNGDIIFHYKQSEYYQGAQNQFTYRFDDPKFNILWPINNSEIILSKRDDI